MKTKVTLITLCLFFIAISCFSQSTQAQNELLGHLTGKWVLQGTIAGQQTTHDVSVDRVLGDQYVEVTEVSHEKEADGKPSYDAKVFITWNRGTNLYDCLWLDNTGNEGLKDGAAGHAPYEPNKLKFTFKTGTGNFYTTFIYDKLTDSWQWLMDGEENNKLQPFARLKMVRQTSGK
jgi:hypothetical protein